MRNILTSSVLAGLLAGLLWGGLVVFFVSPLILQAEAYESEAPLASHEHDEDHSHSHSGEGTADTSLRRNFFTLLGTTSLGLFFGILSSLVVLLLAKLNAFSLYRVSWIKGLGFGMGGFAVFHLIPSLGLPPPPPGIVGAAHDFSSRQSWWLMTTLFSTMGMLSPTILPSVFEKFWGARRFLAKGVATIFGILLIAFPFILGVPPHSSLSNVPLPLQNKFLWTSLSVSCVFWIAFGASFFFFLKRGYLNKQSYRTTHS